MDNASLPLESWANFYVIVGSSAGGLTGLTFVVITLIADAGTVRLPGLRAFITPTVVHFCSVLGIAALLNVPGQTHFSMGLCLGAGGVVGVIYSIGTALKLNSSRPEYVPVASDWIWNVVLPTLSYLGLLAAGMLSLSHAPIALDVTGGASLLLLFIGIHNAWDIAVWFTAERPARQRQAAQAAQSAPSTQPGQSSPITPPQAPAPLPGAER
jgi:hypothetical protein